MSAYAECLEALPGFRNEILRRQIDELEQPPTAFAAAGAFSAFATPSNNIHATGVGIRCRKGKYDEKEFVLKVYVYNKLPSDAPGVPTTKEWNGTAIDVEELPVQMARAAPGAAVPQQRQRRRPIVGGISISPLNADFVGTLGCFVRRVTAGGTQQIFALSNNHVLADVDSLPIGTRIVQPGPETGPTQTADVFARLHSAIPIRFPTGGQPVANRFDAALAAVTDQGLIRRGAMFGINAFDPSRIATPRPGMRVTKCGRTTGVTRGLITATNVQGVNINYGTPQQPRITTFTDTVSIRNPGGPSFSRPGDSGSVILEEATGNPVALLFAGDSNTTTACEFGALCTRLRILPV